MVAKDFHQLITQMLLVSKENLSKQNKIIINKFQTMLEDNYDLIRQANDIDIKNNNGFPLDKKIINNIFKNVSLEKVSLGEITELKKDNEKKLIYGKQIMGIGNVLVINDGNTYIIIEMILRNIIAGNPCIFINKGYMFGTNELIIKLLNDLLTSFNLANLIQLFVADNYDIIYKNFANIDLIIGIVKREEQNQILKNSLCPVLLSGMENFEIYLDDDLFPELILNSLKINSQIILYVKEYLDYACEQILVADLDEAIARINYEGSHYSTAIFTKTKENAAKFISEVKSKQVVVNTSPLIERLLDIKEEDLVIEKTIIYPSK